jgi:hypothetical protein
MKRFLLLAVMGAGLSATAQQQPELKKLYDYFKKVPAIAVDTTGERFKKLEDLIQTRGLLPQATFSHNTSKGKIYTLPIDNMPCLVPDMKQVRPMPGQYVNPDNKMPNAMPKQEIIPKEKRAEKNN